MFLETFFNPFRNRRGQTGSEGEDTQRQTGQQQEEKLLAGKYKNAEELEKAYKEQESGYDKLKNEINDMRSQLQQFQQMQQGEPFKKKEPEEDYSQYFDKDSLEIIKKISQEEAQKASREGLSGYEKMNKFQQGLIGGWQKAQSEFGSDYDFVVNGKPNPESELYKRAEEILGRKYTQKFPNGEVIFTTPDAHYLSVVEAYAQLAREGKSRKSSETSQDKRKRLSNLSGKGGQPSGKGKLTQEQYLALSDAEKDAYDRQGIETKLGGQ